MPRRGAGLTITEVRAWVPHSPLTPAGWRGSMGQIAVAIDTDGGLRGYGVGGGGAAGVHVVRSVLRDLLLDRDPAPVERLWREMYAATLPFGRKGLTIMALSGVDLALWDLRGKAAAAPVAALLGAATDTEVPCYLTLGQLPAAASDSGGAPRSRASRAAAAVAAASQRGYAAVKLGLGTVAAPPGEWRAAVDLMLALRAELGAAPALMLDAGMAWDREAALAASLALAPAQLGWLEEPLPADDLEGYRDLARRSPLSIAGGEHEFTAEGFRMLLEMGAHHVLQPDICWCGGMTVLRQVYRMAAARGIPVRPHRGAEVWGLHAISALDPDPLAESPRPWLTWVEGAPEIRNGTAVVADAPGFGVVFSDRQRTAA